RNLRRATQRRRASSSKDENGAALLGQGGADSSALVLSGWLEAGEDPKAQPFAAASPPPLGLRPNIPSSIEEGSLLSGKPPTKSRLAEEGKVTRRPTR